MKSYDEIANSIFERRDVYIAKQKKKKRIILAVAIPSLFCCFVLVLSFGLLKSDFFNNISKKSSETAAVDSSSNNNSSAEIIVPSEPSNSDSHQNEDSTDGNNSSEDAFSQEENDSSSSPYIDSPSQGSDYVFSDPFEEVPSEPFEDTPSNDIPISDTDYFIDSFDKINFYSAKKIISENSLFPFDMRNYGYSKTPIFLNNSYTEYPIDRNKIFTTTMVTYFTIVINSERGFLAQKLGGTGLVEVVVTENDLEDMGRMITFKRGENYYSCFSNSYHYDTLTKETRIDFSSHKYIDGFNIVKDLSQENYKFTVTYEGSKVIGFSCSPFKSTPSEYIPDDITFIEDLCIVLYTKQTFTIDELEVFFKNENEGDAI